MKSLILSLATILIFSCNNSINKNMSDYNQPPKVKQIPKELKIHGDVRVDEFYWLNDRNNPEVVDYLNKENDYYKQETQHTKNFQEDLFDEMKSRIKKNDTSVPYKFNGYWYITRYEKGKDYPIYTRKKESLDSKEELLFDCNVMAKDHSYFRLVGLNVSPNNQYVSYGVDTTGRRQYKLLIKDLKSNKVFKEEVWNTTGGSTWANDNKTLFYVLKDETTLRSEAVYKHRLNTSSDEDELVYEEIDDTFGVGVYKTKSQKYLVISSYSTLTSEHKILNANTPDGTFKLFQPRIRGLEYSISHFENSFYIVSNSDNAQNFKLSKTSEKDTEISNWIDVIPHRENVLLEGIDIFKDFLVISERENGLNKIKISKWDNSSSYYLPFNSETYTAYTTTNIDFDTSKLRYSYQSLTTPSSVIEFDMLTKEKNILKEQEVLNVNFKKENYISKRLWATRYYNGEALYPFGHGLSYTNFKYSKLRADKTNLNEKENFKISFNIKNIGVYDGDEVVQVYIKDLKSKLKMPIKQLRGFKRVSLSKGGEKVIEFEFKPIEDFSYYDTDQQKYMVDKGSFEIQVGSSSQDIRLKKTIYVD